MIWWALLVALVAAGSFGFLWVVSQEEARVEDENQPRVPPDGTGRDGTGSGRN